MRAIRPTLVALLLALAVTAPASAAEPERIDEPLFQIFPDPKHDLVVFWNITRDDFCAWEESGFLGDAPVTQLVPVQSIETANGAVVFKYSATSNLELWAADADADFDLSDPCADTDDSSSPWATGSAHVVGNDNDLFISGSRTNSFGDRGQGTVWDASGAAWRYNWTYRVRIDRDFEFSVAADRTNLHRLR